MADQTKGKYGALAELSKKPAAEPIQAPRTAEPEQLLPKNAKPQGKRSDPDWKQYSILLKKESHKKAGLILREKYEGVDISDLMQNLLENWLKTE